MTSCRNCSQRVFNIEKQEWRFDLKQKGKFKPPEMRDHLAFFFRGELNIIGGHQGNHIEHIKEHFILDSNTFTWRRGPKPDHFFCRG
jgi:hypothetical protein